MSSCPGSWLTGDAPLRAPEGFDEENNNDQATEAVRRQIAEKYARRQSAVEQRMAALEKIMASRQMSQDSARAASSRHIDESSRRVDPPPAKRTSSRQMAQESASVSRTGKSSRSSRRAPPPPPPVDKAVVVNEDYDSDTSDVDTHSWDVVQIKPVQDMSTISSGDGSSCWRTGRWICIALLAAALIAVAVTVPLLLTRDKRTTNTSAATTTDLSYTPTGPLSTEPPTAAPVVQLPSECLTLSDSVDVCLTEEMTQEEATFCVDCMWRFLPDNKGYCEPLETAVCNIVQSCGCSTCKDELVRYLDCQTECEFECT